MKICDTCEFYRPKREVLLGDGECGGECSLTGLEVGFLDTCENHKTDEWFEYVR